MRRVCCPYRSARLTPGRAQVELDYKSECMAGQTVESIGSRVVEDTNGTGVLRCAAPAGSPAAGQRRARPSKRWGRRPAHSALTLAVAQNSVACCMSHTNSCLLRFAELRPAPRVRRFVHLLRRCDESGCHELVRARTTWRPNYPKF